MAGVLELAKTVGPLLLRAALSGRLFRPPVQLEPPHPDVEAQWSVPIPVSSGDTLTAQIFHSRSARAAGERRPVVMCAHPYDNRNVPALGRTPLGGPPVQYRIIPQVGRPRFSTLTSWEAPDPNFWVPAGYTVVNLNLPGFGGSGGSASVFGPDQAAAYFDAIEYVADQPWCTGSVGLSGVSFLAITQYFVAACAARGGRAPRGLKAISPWEGFTDLYRDVVRPGGVTERGFPAFWWNLEVKPSLTGGPEAFLTREGTPEGWVARHPMLDDFWLPRLPALEEIEVPMLVCASFSDHGLHTDGSFRAFERARGPKWVFTHRGGKWASFYSDEVKALLKSFFDCFVKGERDNGFLRRAPVRLEVRSARDVVHAARDEQEWPLARTRWTRLFLDAAGGQLRTSPVAPHTHALDAGEARVSFDHLFEQDTELTGPMVLALDLEVRVEAGTAVEDAVLFAAVEKLDAAGARVPFHGSVGNPADAVTRGCLAASHRLLDEHQSRPWLPVPAHRDLAPVPAGEVLPLRIALSPSSTFFARGERLRLVISGAEIIPSAPYRKDAAVNRGQHVLHLGGAHLLVPVIPHQEAGPGGPALG